jgi:hypothetical protein
MRFVLVNGRMPCKQSFCVLCGEPIRGSYLRETGPGAVTAIMSATPVTAKARS